MVEGEGEVPLKITKTLKASGHIQTGRCASVTADTEIIIIIIIIIKNLTRF